MISDTTALSSILVIACIFYIGFLWATRRIQFAFPEGEDSMNMVRIAGMSSFRWPAQLVEKNNLGTFLKGLNIFLLIIFQKIFNDKKSIRPLISLWGITNSVSAILLYLIGAEIFNPTVSLFVALLFITSFWPWQTALSMGHINLATMFFLAGTLSTLYIEQSGSTTPLWIFLSGIFYALTFFSSSSSTNYIPYTCLALLFGAYRTTLETYGLIGLVYGTFKFTNEILIVYLLVPVLIYIFFRIASLPVRWLVSKMYMGKLPHWITRLLAILRLDMAGKNIFPIEHYESFGSYKIKSWRNWMLRGFLFWSMVVYPLGLNFILIFILGTIPIILFLTMPNIKEGLWIYWHYIRETQIRQKTAFRGWVNYFNARGIKVDRYFVAGASWLPKFFWRFIPGPFLLVNITFVASMAFAISQHTFYSVATIAVLFLLAYTRCFWGELTNSPKLGRIYLPIFPGFLLFIGYTFNKFWMQDSTITVYFLLISLVIIFSWNLKKYLGDILPSRMAISNLVTALDALNITDFYTLKTDFNLMLVDAMGPEIRNKYKIHYITKLSEVSSGWIVIPSTSHRTALWITEEIMSGDYEKDPALNNMLETKEIEKIADIKLRTIGSSPLWLMDFEVGSFQDLILHTVDKKDYFRGLSWVLNSKNIPQT